MRSLVFPPLQGDSIEVCDSFVVLRLTEHKVTLFLRLRSSNTSAHCSVLRQFPSIWDEPWLRKRLEEMSRGRYENQVSAVVSKLLLRGKVE